jgi:hypothetical protein
MVPFFIWCSFFFPVPLRERSEAVGGFDSFIYSGNNQKLLLPLLPLDADSHDLLSQVG